MILSVIVPVYNCSTFLSQCLDCLVNQDLDPDSYEVLCIDDGSTDSSSEIIKKYSLVYPFIKYFYKQNEGVSATRNYGITLAQGKYLMFVDSDDGITENIFKSLINQMIELDLSVLRFSYSHVFDNNPIKSIQIKELAFMDKFVNLDDVPYQVWGVIYRTKLICENNIKFNTTLRTREDYLFNLFYFSQCIGKKNRVIQTPIYIYRVRHGSLSHCMNYSSNKFQKERLNDMMLYISECKSFLDLNQTNKVLRTEMQKKIDYFVCTALLISLRCKDIVIKNVRLQLKEMGVYPIQIPSIANRYLLLMYLLTHTFLFNIIDRLNLFRRRTRL